MTDRDMRKLSRADLLEMLINQSIELDTVKRKLAETEAALQKKEYTINTAGSIAEAALQLSGIFEAAETASQKYMDNIRLLSARQEEICDRIEQESREKARRHMEETEKQCVELENEVKLRCAEMLAKAKAESQSCWDELAARLDAYYEEHIGLRELLSVALSRK